MRAFYDSQVESIFSSKVIILPNNRKNYLKVQWPLIFRCRWYRGFSKIDITNFVSFRIISYHFVSFLVRKRLCHLVFMQFPLFSNNCWNKRSQETWLTWPLLYFYLSFKIFQYFGVICITVWDFKKALVEIIWHS